MKTLQKNIGIILLAAALFLGTSAAQADHDSYYNGHRGYYDNHHGWHNREQYHNHYGYFNRGIFIRID